MLSVIIPASNEESWIADCLEAVLASQPVPGGVEVIVVANGCRDRTADVARAGLSQLPEGWAAQVIDLEKGSKPGALNAGDRAAQGGCRVYLDADCQITPEVLPQIATALSAADPVYAGATPVIPRARSAVTRAYARFWQRLPFTRSVAPGYGLYAVNPAGRARWEEFPAVISDDTFVRLQFLPAERRQVPARYDWPMVEGFKALVRVRRRQDQGVRELEDRYPGLLQREGKARLTTGGLIGLALRDPVGFAVYAAVAVAVRRSKGTGAFVRGR